MRIGAPPPPDPSIAPAAREAAPSGVRFGALLQQRLQEPRDRIDLTREALRAAIDDVRPGAALAPAPAPTSAATLYAPPRAFEGGADPFGWRELTRRLGEEIVGPGFGAVFEAQIEQESGFDPEVVYGHRRSSAGAEGIAQLMPQYYPGVDRRDPQASLVAGAQSMRHYLSANGGDVRKALASYNAGLGAVQSLVAAHGTQWERALPTETKQYLAAILGSEAPALRPSGRRALPFGGRGPHGVLTSPLDGVLGQRELADALALLARPGSTVRAPADGRVVTVAPGPSGLALELDHGNGWTSILHGLGAASAAVGDLVRRGEALGALPHGPGATAALRLDLTRDGRPLDPRPYLIGAFD